MTDRYHDIKQRLCDHAEQDKDIKAVIAIGSSTRSNVPADEYSDLDLIIVTSAPDRWYSGEYPALLGNVSISFIEPTLGGGKERRCIYDDDRDVDMIIFTPLQFENAVKEGVAEWVMNRGWILLYDSGDYAEMIPQFVTLEVHHAVMTDAEYENTVNDFFFHNIWVYKKLRRGELWAAKMCIDGYLKECFAHYDSDDCRCALSATHKLFARLARTVADRRGIIYPEKAEECARTYITGTTDEASALETV